MVEKQGGGIVLLVLLGAHAARRRLLTPRLPTVVFGRYLQHPEGLRSGFGWNWGRTQGWGLCRVMAYRLEAHRKGRLVTWVSDRGNVFVFLGRLGCGLGVGLWSGLEVGFLSCCLEIP